MKQHLTLRRRRVHAGFALSFPDGGAAREAGVVLADDGYSVDLRGRLVLAERDVREDSFDVAEALLGEIASRFGGSYLGRQS